MERGIACQTESYKGKGKHRRLTSLIVPIGPDAVPALCKRVVFIDLF